MRKGSQGCVVPNHKEIKIGTLGGLLKQAGVSTEDFISSLNALPINPADRLTASVDFKRYPSLRKVYAQNQKALASVYVAIGVLRYLAR